jgi:hypothetical protein
VIKEIMRTAMIEQQLAVPDIYNPSILLETELSHAAPKRFAQTVTINGEKKIVEGDSELSVQRQVNDLYRETFAAQEHNPAPQQQETEQPRDAAGRFTADTRDPVAAAELDLRFKRGEISAADYIQQSGALDEYLSKKGVPLEALRESIAEKQNSALAQEWAATTDKFRARHPEWIGGQENVNIIGQILSENNLVDAEDKLGAMEAAYNHARENSLLVGNPEVDLRDRINSARTPAELQNALGMDDRQRSAGFWR